MAEYNPYSSEHFLTTSDDVANTEEGTFIVYFRTSPNVDGAYESKLTDAWTIKIDKTKPSDAALIVSEKTHAGETISKDNNNKTDYWINTDTLYVRVAQEEDRAYNMVMYRLGTSGTWTNIELTDDGMFSNGQITGLQNGANTIQIRTVDEAGNESIVTYVIRVELSDINITIDKAESYQSKFDDDIKTALPEP